MSFSIDDRYRGPRESGNGGYTSGLLAGELGMNPAMVTLRKPPPLLTAMSIEPGEGNVLLRDGDVTVAEVSATVVGMMPKPVEPVGIVDAHAAEAHYAGLDRHPFPECFVCGPERAQGDGMRLLPGRLGDGRTACVWTVADDLAGRPEFVWAALDCPGGWSAPIEGRPMVLGRMTAEVLDIPKAGEDCVVMGLLSETDGRKTHTTTTLYGHDGRELGRAHAVWIALPGT